MMLFRKSRRILVGIFSVFCILNLWMLLHDRNTHIDIIAKELSENQEHLFQNQGHALTASPSMVLGREQFNGSIYGEGISHDILETSYESQLFKINQDETKENVENTLKTSLRETMEEEIIFRDQFMAEGSQIVIKKTTTAIGSPKIGEAKNQNEGRNRQHIDIGSITTTPRYKHKKVDEINPQSEAIVLTGRHNVSDELTFPMILRSEDPHTQHVYPWGPRPKDCDTKVYGSDLPNISIIICFHEHESLTDILHTLHSIIQRTPSSLLHEVILIDDYSSKEDFKSVLENYIRAIMTGPQIKIYRSRRPLGLIQARLLGAKLATADIIVSMDSHMEVQTGWLEPLLTEIVMNPKTLATSYLDWMERGSDGSWTFRHGASSWKTYFDWNLVFGFQSSSRALLQTDSTAPISSPVTVGTIFAIKKSFFFDIGAFDDQMAGWGGENLDLPIRVWLFGGRVINVPCSHAAHLEKSGSRGYRNTWQNIIDRNYKRVIEVWFGNYKKYAYYYNPKLKDVDAGDLSSRKLLQKRAPKTFEWFLHNVFPQLGIYDEDTLAWGLLRNLKYGTCMHASAPWQNPFLKTCDEKIVKEQTFFLKTDGELRFPIHIFKAEVKGGKGTLVINEYYSVYNTSDISKWIHWNEGPIMLYPASQNLCLDATTGSELIITKCQKNEPSQQWAFQTYSEIYNSLIKNNSTNMDPYAEH